MADAAVGGCLFAGLITAWGAASSHWLIAPRVLGRRQLTLVAAARNVGIGGSAVLAVAMGLVFWRQMRDFRDPLVPWQADAGVLLATPWGLAWKLAVAGVVVLMVAFVLATPASDESPIRRGAWVAARWLAGAMCAFPAFIGHAVGTGGLRWLTVPADTLHVLSAGSWIGGLIFVLVAERRERLRTGRGNALLAEVVPHFSPVALVAAAVLIGTGSFAATVHVESLEALVASDYGRILLTKIGLVMVVLILGAINWRRYAPRLWGAGGARPLRRNAILELVVAHVVILLTALLVRTAPLTG